MTKVNYEYLFLALSFICLGAIVVNGIINYSPIFGSWMLILEVVFGIFSLCAVIHSIKLENERYVQQKVLNKSL